LRKICIIILLLATIFSISEANPDSRSRNVVIWDQTQESQGSGVILDGSILTAQHVVGDSTFVYVRYFNSDKLEIEMVKKTDKELDLALLSCNRPGVVFSRIANSGPVVGDNVYTIGSGCSHPFSLKYGNISNTTDTHYLVDLSVYPGDSGAPLYNNNDEVVGVIQAVDVVWSSPGQAYARKLEDVRRFLYE